MGSDKKASTEHCIGLITVRKDRYLKLAIFGHKIKFQIYIQNRPSVLIYSSYIMRYSQLVPWKHESVGHQQVKPNDVRRIMSTHEGSFVFIIHPT